MPVRAWRFDSSLGHFEWATASPSSAAREVSSSGNECKRTVDSSTNLSLLAKLRNDPTDQQSWEQFVERYGRRIYTWGLGWGLQESDAQDLTQNVLVALSRQMKQFEYKPSGRFRSWLKTVAYRAWVDLLEERRKLGTHAPDSLLVALLNDQAREGFLEQLEEAANRELMEIAIQRVRARIQPQTWEAFRLTQMEALSPQTAAERLNMKSGSVYVARTRVRQLLMDELELLDRDREP